VVTAVAAAVAGVVAAEATGTADAAG
jgi:hypothetical protein